MKDGIPSFKSIAWIWKTELWVKSYALSKFSKITENQKFPDFVHNELNWETLLTDQMITKFNDSWTYRKLNKWGFQTCFQNWKLTSELRGIISQSRPQKTCFLEKFPDFPDSVINLNPILKSWIQPIWLRNDYNKFITSVPQLRNQWTS